MKHEHALRIAGQLIVDLSKYCEYIKVGGSIRRKKPEVKDIELICIPKFGESRTGQGTLLDGEVKEIANLLFGHIIANGDKYDILKMGEKYAQIEVFGEHAIGVRQHIKVDIFTATPETWGYILLLRTGPADFSKWVVTELKKIGFTPNDGAVWSNEPNEGMIKITTPTEGPIFDMLGIDYIKPEDRRAP
jgi:DNA polymerase/3'-5' exonuclease PolX